MNRYPSAAQRVLPLFWSLILLLASPAAGEILTIDEDFSSTARRDDTLSTAAWDTVQQNAHLRSQVLRNRATVATTAAYYSALGPESILLADGTGGLRSIGLDDPDEPVLLDQLTFAEQARGVAVFGTTAFVTIGGSGLAVVDIGNPADMQTLATFDPGGSLRYVNAVALSYPAAYLAESDSGVTVVDVSDPAQPTFVRRLETGTWARDVHVRGNLLFAVDTTVRIYSLADPFNPLLIGTYDPTGTPLRVNVAGDRAFVACGAAGLDIVDIANPTEAQLLGNIDQWSSCRHAAASASGDTAFVAAGPQGLAVLDVHDPTDPREIGTRPTPGPAGHALYHQGLILLATGTAGLRIDELDPYGLDRDNNRIQTINLNTTDDPISRVALNAAGTDSVHYAISANGGGTWQVIASDGQWLDLNEPATDIRWRAELVPVDGGPVEGPTIYHVSLTMERLSSNPAIVSVDDVPADDGGQVRVRWLRSRHDDAGGEFTITEYSVYRRYAGRARDVPGEPPYPPGQWDYLTSVPADREQEYSLVAPTLADSNAAGLHTAVFFVRARTSQPGIFFDSAPDSGYSVNNRQPAPPTGLVIIYQQPAGTLLQWDASQEPDFAHFRIYRSLVAGQPPSPGTLHAVTDQTSFLDPTQENFHYQLTQVDQAGRESEPAHYLSPVAPAVPDLAWLGNQPNPFNPTTELSLRTDPDGGPVRVGIFDSRGRLVRRFDAQPPGNGLLRLRWDGRDDQGRLCASGAYLAHLRQGTVTRRGKMLLVR
ncbi:hypothetical protein CSB20_04480 [bacterium DOLZORAL124_64_63]|nr:MAG: hypothetical protein CSB20_04480 [bacterium DOLZORAL124_64_63]